MTAGHQDGGGVKDTGWAWMTVIAGFIMHFLVVGGAHKSFGILYIELVEKFDTSSRATLSIVAVSQSLCMLLGPLANAFALRFTSRRTVMIGGLLMSAGFVLSMFPPNIGYLYFSYGLVVGLGCALAYSPTIVTIGQYFSKRRALASGLSVAGSGLGNFFVPPLIRGTLDRYGFGGTMLIMAGLTLNVCLAGALLRPIVASRPPAVATPRDAPDQERTGNDVENRGEKSSVVVEQNVKINGETVQLKIENGRHQEEPTSTSGCCRASSTSGLCGACVRLFDWNLLANPVFLVYAFASMLLFTGYPPLYIMLPDHAVRSAVGASKPAAALLLSILGLSDVVGRIGFGILADFNLVPKRFLFAGCMSVAGSLICVLPHVKSYVGLAITCSVVGLFVGAFFTLLMVVLAEKFGVHRLHAAFGLVATFMGTSFFYSAPIVGTLRDSTGSWTASFTFSGVAMLCGAALLLLDPVAVRYQESRAERRHAADCSRQQRCAVE